MPVPLKNRQQGIPGGFDWVEPQTGWTFKSDIFTVTRDAIIQQRTDNPRHKLRTDPEHVEWEMEQRYVARLSAMPGGQQWLVPTPDNPSPPVFRTPRSRDAHAAGLSKVANAKAGIGVLLDWLGAGLKNVAPELANGRAEVCARCPQNKEGDFWQRMEGVAANQLKALVESKNDMKLATPHDAKLFSCQACDCYLPLKVHVQLKHILDHTSDTTFAALDQGCWIRSEKANV
jgi:hypothetical protein